MMNTLTIQDINTERGERERREKTKREIKKKGYRRIYE
jgi:hypothetical protein